jgi:hypothetical protein
MKGFARSAMAFVLLVLGGCAANVKHDPKSAAVHVDPAASKAIELSIDGSATATESKDWEAFKGEWRGAMHAAASAAHIGYVESPAVGTSAQAATHVSIYVNDYRYISPGARYGLGIMTGNAFVDARATYTDAQSAASFGERTYNTSSTAWQGVFSAMTAKQIQAICTDIVADVTGGDTSSAH